MTIETTFVIIRYASMGIPVAEGRYKVYLITEWISPYLEEKGNTE